MLLRSVHVHDSGVVPERAFQLSHKVSQQTSKKSVPNVSTPQLLPVLYCHGWTPKSESFFQVPSGKRALPDALGVGPTKTSLGHSDLGKLDTFLSFGFDDCIWAEHFGSPPPLFSISHQPLLLRLALLRPPPGIQCLCCRSHGPVHQHSPLLADRHHQLPSTAASHIFGPLGSWNIMHFTCHCVMLPELSACPMIFIACFANSFSKRGCQRIRQVSLDLLTRYLLLLIFVSSSAC